MSSSFAPKFIGRSSVNIISALQRTCLQCAALCNTKRFILSTFLVFLPPCSASERLPPRWFPDWASCEFIGCNLPLLLSSLNIHKTLWECVSPLFAVFPVQWTCGTLRSLALVNIHSHLFHPVDVIKLPHSSSLWIFTQLHILSSFPSCSFPGIALQISYLTAWDKTFLVYRTLFLPPFSVIQVTRFVPHHTGCFFFTVPPPKISKYGKVNLG